MGCLALEQGESIGEQREKKKERHRNAIECLRWGKRERWWPPAFKELFLCTPSSWLSATSKPTSDAVRTPDRIRLRRGEIPGVGVTMMTLTSSPAVPTGPAELGLCHRAVAEGQEQKSCTVCLCHLLLPGAALKTAHSHLPSVPPSCKPGTLLSAFPFPFLFLLSSSFF